MFSKEAYDIALVTAMLVDSGASVYNLSWRKVEENHILKQLRKFGLKPKYASGAYRNVLIFDDFVLKVPQDTRWHALRSETSFIRKMRSSKKYRRHFLETDIVEAGEALVQIQERVNMNVSPAGFERLVPHVERLGEMLGIDDIHDENYTWRGPAGREYPVFVDVDIRNGRSPLVRQPKKKLRSWMVTAQVSYGIGWTTTSGWTT